jgi:hypothetical protein
LDLADENALVAGLAESLHRKDLAPRERVAALRLLVQIHRPGTQLGGSSSGGHAAIRPPPRQENSSADLARRLGVDVSTVSRLAALGRDEHLLGMVESGVVGLTAASHVARLPAAMRPGMLEDIETEHLSASATHLRVNQLLREGPRPAVATGQSETLRQPSGATLHRLRCALGTLATIHSIETEPERHVLGQIERHLQRLRKG